MPRISEATEKYKFYGNAPCSMMGVVEFQQFGQEASLTDEQTLDILLSGGGIIKSADFDGVEFPAEMQRHRKRRTGDQYMAYHLKAGEKREELLKELQAKHAAKLSGSEGEKHA